MADTLVNRVASSGIMTIDLEVYYPTVQIVEIDLKDYLYMELILKEKDFRTALKGVDWNSYKGQQVLVNCSVDAIIPMWAYMLVATYLQGVAVGVYQGDMGSYLAHYYEAALGGIDLQDYRDKMVVIKGCGDKPVPAAAYLKLTTLLQPVAKSIMYGEPCSTVPIYKRPRPQS